MFFCANRIKSALLVASVLTQTLALVHTWGFLALATCLLLTYREWRHGKISWPTHLHILCKGADEQQLKMTLKWIHTIEAAQTLLRKV